MEDSEKWESLCFLIATAGLAVFIVSESPEQSLLPGWDYELAVVIFNTGIMGRSLVSALNQKPDIMIARNLVYAWLVPFAATFVIAIQFVHEGHLDKIHALLLVTALGSVFSLLVGEIEERDE